MFHENLYTLRKLRQKTQEELAEAAGVSRQAYAKWETGETVPDLIRAGNLAAALGVSLDELVSYRPDELGLPVPPRGKHVFGVVKVGEKGQVVIPHRARKIFGIEPGDRLIVLGDESQGLAMVREADFLAILKAIQAGEA